MGDIMLARRLGLLADVLSDRLRVKIREEIGGAYSPSAGSAPFDTYPGYGYLTALLTVEPAQATKIADAVEQIATDLAEHGVTDEELNRAKRPLLTKLHESARTNAYWLENVLSRAQGKPAVLGWDVPFR